MPLSRTEAVADSNGNAITLTEGMPVFVYEPDADWYGRDDYLLADGVATWCDDAHGRGPMWCVRLDDRGVRHESDEPGFAYAAMTPQAMREKMYQAIEQAVTDVPEPDRWSVRQRVKNFIEELRSIDAGVRA